MPTQRKLWQVFLVLATACSLSFSCSTGPSDDTVRSTIAESLRRQVPSTWSGSLLACKTAQIELIEIKQRGKFNKKAGYWPIKARVKGSCEVDLVFKKEMKEFDQVGDFRLYQDDYGEWKASIQMAQ